MYLHFMSFLHINLTQEKDLQMKQTFNPLRARFFRGNINIYLHLVSFLHID